MLTLTLTAELEGVTGLGQLIPRRAHTFTRSGCNVPPVVRRTRTGLASTALEEHEIPGSRGEANFVWRCRLCSKTHSASIIAGPHAYEAGEKKTGQKIIDIDCRGLEFTEFKPDGDWEAKGVESSTPFSGIELIEGEWYDYDEKAGEEVSIKEMTWSIGRS